MNWLVQHEKLRNIAQWNTPQCPSALLEQGALNGKSLALHGKVLRSMYVVPTMSMATPCNN
jgi:hypothetical protein